MKPYYEEAGITIYCGDCLEVMPELDVEVDLVLTDPPYGIGENHRKNASREKLAKPRDYGFYNWDRKVSQSLIESIIKAGRHVCIWGGNFYRVPPSSCWLVWDKQNSGDFADCEIAWTNYGIAVRLKHHLWNGMIRKGNEARFHPTQKPLAVIKWAIGLCPGSPQSILDPFMGSGTTLVAAKELGRKAIGIEIEEKYCEIAIDRLRQGVLPFKERS